MGNATSVRSTTTIGEDQEPIPGTSSVSSFTSLSSSTSDIYNDTSPPSSQQPSTNPNPIHSAKGPLSTNSTDECFRLSIFRKRRDPLRLIDHGNHSIQNNNGSNYRSSSLSDYHDAGEEVEENDRSCFQLPTSASSVTSANSTKRFFIEVRQSSVTDASTPNHHHQRNHGDLMRRMHHDQQDEDDDAEENYYCTPAYGYKKSQSSLSNPSSTTSAAAESSLSPSPLEVSSKKYYDCYPSSSSSYFSKCGVAGLSPSGSSGFPLFMDGGPMGSTGYNNDWTYTQEELDMIDGDEPTDSSDLRPVRHYWIVTTASLPWMTGTAINPLLRAAYLSQRNRRLLQTLSDPDAAATIKTPSTVTLVLPWLECPEDRSKLYGPAWATPDKTPDYQEAYIREWLATSAHLPLEAASPSEGGLAIEWYPARYHAALSSIFALGDLCELIPTDAVVSETGDVGGNKKSNMICILEEPEHVNFYRAPGRESWRDKFVHVIGIVHTNYKAYARNHYSGFLTSPLVGALSSLMVRAYCDKVVKLSPVLQTYAPGKEVVSNVHGIRHEFFQVPLMTAQYNNEKVKCYFIGKLLWAKGLDKLLELEAHYRKKTGQYFEIDIVGSGPEQGEIQRSFLGAQQKLKHNNPTSNDATSRRNHWRYFRQPIPARFLGRIDHAEIGSKYKIFVNPSITEVLCTTTAEAIAMGKWVIVPKHPSNDFFLQFSNCLQYSTKNEFVELMQFALANPVHFAVTGLEEAQDRSQFYAPLTWELATERLIDSAYLSKREARRRDRLTLHKEDRSIQEWHYALGNGKSGDVLRKFLGGGPVAEQSTYKRLPSSISLSSSSISLTAVS